MLVRAFGPTKFFKGYRLNVSKLKTKHLNWEINFHLFLKKELGREFAKKKNKTNSENELIIKKDPNFVCA